MGYRELLKRYMSFLESHLGSAYLDALASDPDAQLGPRDLAELRSLLSEINRDTAASHETPTEPDFNRRLALLCLCYGLSAVEAAELARVDVETLRRWRTSPRSTRYLPMGYADFRVFERSLFTRVDGTPVRPTAGQTLCT